MITIRYTVVSAELSSLLFSEARHRENAGDIEKTSEGMSELS